MVVDCLSKAASQQPTAIKEAEEQLRSWEQQVFKAQSLISYLMLQFLAGILHNSSHCVC